MHVTFFKFSPTQPKILWCQSPRSGVGLNVLKHSFILIFSFANTVDISLSFFLVLFWISYLVIARLITFICFFLWNNIYLALAKKKIYFFDSKIFKTRKLNLIPHSAWCSTTVQEIGVSSIANRVPIRTDQVL